MLGVSYGLGKKNERILGKNMAEIIYQVNPLEALTNQMWQLQRLQEEGRNVGSALEETWDKIAEIIHGEDEEKLGTLRERISDIIREEKHTKLMQKMWEEEKNEP